MLIVVRDGAELSPKTRFVLQLLKLTSNPQILYLVKKSNEKLEEKSESTRIELAASTSGVFANCLLMLLKSPGDLRDGLLRRLFKRQKVHVLVNEGFLSVLSEALQYCFANLARTNEIMPFLTRLKPPRIFLIDEFISISTINLKLLKQMGPIIYVSPDHAADRFGFADNLVAKKLMYKLESDAVPLTDIVITCSERDRLKYVEMGAKKAVSYPNIYPVLEFEPGKKDETPSISIVLQGYWGPRGESSLGEIFGALSRVNKKVRVYMIGVKPKQVPKNVELLHYERLPSKLDYLNSLSKSWIGINIGIHLGGTNERKYDYAMANLVVFSDNFGARGDLLPHEYVYVDGNDLAGKLSQLLEFGKDAITEMGKQNRKQALLLVEKQREKLLTALKF